MLRIWLAVAFLPTAGLLYGYSVLTHEAIIDSAWLDDLQPVLKARFPDAGEDALREAHAYAYGGCILQDMGYYPFGSRFFSDLVHYVRSGEFVEELIRSSTDINEYAFALGALAHYVSDNTGHPLAVNPSVALVYPKLRARYGKAVTYADDPAAHLKVEFGFDVLQVAQGRYAPKAYHDFVGFKVSKPLLERAFRNTYGMDLADLFASLDLALGTYRRTVSGVLPEATKVAWEIQKNEILKAEPGTSKKRFLYKLSRASYRREWGRDYRRPGPFAKVLAFLFRLLPKFGPFRGIEFKPPTPDTARLFMGSFNNTVDRYRSLLHDVRGGRLRLPNRDFDTGDATAPGEYGLADDTYSKLLRTLGEKDFTGTTPEIRTTILAFFQEGQGRIATSRHKKAWRDTLRALDRLKEQSAPPQASLQEAGAGVSTATAAW